MSGQPDIFLPSSPFPPTAPESQFEEGSQRKSF